MSRGVERRPSGIVAMNFLRFSGVSPPMKLASSGVSPATGQSALTRILSGASSTAIALVKVIAAPLEPLYQTRPGRGRSPAVEAVLMMQPPPWRRLDPAGDGLAATLVDVVDHHPRAFLGEALGDAFAEAGAAAGDDRHLACEPHGCVLPIDFA